MEQKAKITKVVSLIRASGKLHIGHYEGVIKNWVALQDKYPSFFGIADWHALTTKFKEPKDIEPDTQSILVDLLACGLDPKKSTIFIQSKVKEHAELYLLLSMITPLGWLERNPTYKEQLRELEEREIQTYGFIGYPVLQAADILAYHGDGVPIGQDQVAHLELTREITRRFNNLYGDLFKEPQPILTFTPKVPGTDGRKMSKSYGNAIYLSDSAEEVEKKVKPMKTDIARVTRKDPGNPDVCPVFDLHKIYTPEGPRKLCDTGCRTAGIGCLDCKMVLLEHLQPVLEVIREKREEILKTPKKVNAIIHEGNLRASEVAAKTLTEVREAIGV